MESVQTNKPEIKSVKLPSMEQAIAKAEGFIRSKASPRGKVKSINTYKAIFGIMGQTDIYDIEGNVEIEISPEIRIEAERNFLGGIKVPERFTPAKSIWHIWKVQLRLEDLETLGFDLRF